MGKVLVEMEIEAPLEKVFAFFAEPRNFETLLPKEAKLECEELTPGPIRVGSKRHIKVRIGGRMMEQVMETVEFEENRRAVDRQIDGEMKKFQKTNLFAATAKGTRFTGIIEYEMPYSVLGKIMDKVLVKRQITAYFKGAYDRGKEIVETTV